MYEIVMTPGQVLHEAEIAIHDAKEKRAHVLGIVRCAQEMDWPHESLITELGVASTALSQARERRNEARQALVDSKVLDWQENTMGWIHG